MCHAIQSEIYLDVFQTIFISVFIIFMPFCMFLQNMGFNQHGRFQCYHITYYSISSASRAFRSWNRSSTQDKPGLFWFTCWSENLKSKNSWYCIMNILSVNVFSHLSSKTCFHCRISALIFSGSELDSYLFRTGLLVITCMS